MFGKAGCVSLDVTPTEFLPEVETAHFIACKNYEEKITTIHTCKSYYDVITREESNQQQEQQHVQKNKRIKRILVVDDEHDISSRNYPLPFQMAMRWG